MLLLEIWRYPVKSMAGERLASTVLGPDGIPGDRRLVVVGANGRLATSRRYPKLLGLHTTTAPRRLGAGGRRALGFTRGRRQGRKGSRPRGDDRPGGAPPKASTSCRSWSRPTARSAASGARAAGASGQPLPQRGTGSRRARLGRPHAWRSARRIILDSLRGRCVMTTFDPDSQAEDPTVAPPHRPADGRHPRPQRRGRDGGRDPQRVTWPQS